MKYRIKLEWWDLTKFEPFSEPDKTEVIKGTKLDELTALVLLKVSNSNEAEAYHVSLFKSLTGAYWKRVGSCNGDIFLLNDGEIQDEDLIES